MNKKVMRILLLITLMFASTLIIGTNKSYAATENKTVVVGDWTYNYELRDDGNAYNVYVSKYQNGDIPTLNQLNISIPTELEGHSVKSVGNGVLNIIGKEKLGTVTVHRINIELPDGLESINDHAFEGTDFRGWSIVIPSSVKSIGNWAFANSVNNCNNRRIIIPDSVETIGDYAFANVIERGYSYNPEYNSVVESKSGSSKYWWVKFPSMCRELQLGSGLKSIGKYAFLNQQKLRTVTIPNTLESIGEGAFLNTAIHSVTISDGRTKSLTIGKYAFALTDIEGFTVTSKCIIDDGVFAHCYNLVGVTLEDNITKIPAYTFYNCRLLENVTKTSDITEIGEKAFKGCKTLESEKYQGIVENTTKIGNYAFSGCNGLTGTVTVNSCVEDLGNNVFNSCENIEVVNIEAELTKIPDGTFDKCRSLTDVTKPNTITEIGQKAFYDCTSLNIADSNQTVKNHILSNVTKIDNYAFSGCSGISGELSLGNGLVNLGDYVFSRCSALASVVLEHNYDKLPEGTFSECTLLNNVTMPESITELGKKAFYNCASINMNELEDIYRNIEIFGESCFEGCTGIEGTLVIKNIVTNVGKKAFYNCEGITTIFFEEDAGAQSLGERCFYNTASEQKSIYIYANGGTSIGSRAFTNIEEVFFTDTSVNVSADYKWYGNSEDVMVHYGDCKHLIRITCTLPGVSIVNPENGEDLSSTYVDCEDYFTFKLLIDDEYQDRYPDLKLRIVSAGKFESSDPVVTYVDAQNGVEQMLQHITRDMQIIVSATDDGTDLVLRQFISKLNGSALAETRNPNVKVVNKQLALLDYNHTKYPVNVNKGDKITYTVRVYNEGKDTDGDVDEIKVRIPDGLKYVSSSETNTTYGWSVSEDGKSITTSYLADKEIAKYTNKKPEFIDIEYVLEVTGGSLDPTDLVTIAEITNGNDTDSLKDSLSLLENDEYNVLIQDCITQGQNSSRDGYTLVDEDDTDFEYVIVSAQAGTEYSLVVSKIDSVTEDLLNGAKIQLLDEDKNVIEQGITTDGTVTFNEITSYGEGTDKYYLKEVDTPVGYERTMNGEIGIEVIKTLDDQGNLVIEVAYDTEIMDEEDDFNSEDEHALEFIPIETREQLLKIGSGESITVDGESYIFAEEANYKLLNDIDLDNEPVQPIKYMKGVFDGNGKTISNLKIEGENLNVAEVALFRQFSGTIKDLTVDGATVTGINDGTVDGKDKTAINTENSKSTTAVLVGFMEDGEIYNCSVAGSLNCSMENAGGFVGVTRGNVTIKKSTSSVAITATSYNVGGFIGNAMGSHTIAIEECHSTASAISGYTNVGGIVGYSECVINLVNSDNTAQITAIAYNAGGIIGKSEPNGQANAGSVVQYDANSKQIKAYIKSKKAQGEYDLIIRNADLSKEEGNQMLAGAKFSIYDGNGNLLKDNVAVDNDGILAMQDVVINSLTTDVYYIREDEAPSGYEILIHGLIEVKVTKTWDRENGKYIINRDVSIIDDIDEIEEIIPSEDNTNTGRQLERMQTSNVRYKHTQTGILACNNYAPVIANTSNAGGIAGCLVGYSTVENCSNEIPEGGNSYTVIGGNSEIAGGIVSELMLQTEKDEANIINCTNGINVVGGNVGGIVGVSATNTQILNCQNSANITNTSHVGGGILGRSISNTYMEECENTGNVIGNQTSGGIVGNSGMFGYYIITNTGRFDINPTFKDRLEIVDCEVKNCSVTSGDFNAGGVIGSVASTNTVITDCTVTNAMVGSYKSSPYGAGGVVGISEGENLDVSNCKVLKTQINPQGCNSQNSAGIVASVLPPNFSEPQEVNINIKNCDVLGDSIGYATPYCDADCGGIVGILNASARTYSPVVNMTVSGCNVGDYQEGDNVTKTVIEERASGGSMVDPNIGGIAGGLMSYFGEIIIEDCNVNDVDFNVYSNDVQNNLAGIAAYVQCKKVNIQNCNVTNNEFNLTALVQRDCVGGILGYMQNSQVDIYDCNIANNNFNIPYADVGGVVGFDAGTLLLNNCTVSNIEITQSGTLSNSTGNSGGLVGVTGYSEDTEIMNCNVSNLRILNGGENIGGFVGHSMSNIEIKNCKLSGEYDENTKENIFIASIMDGYNLESSNSIGGAIGLAKSNVVLDNIECCSMSMSGPSSDKASGVKAGGLIGQTVSGIATINDAKVKGFDVNMQNIKNAEHSNGPIIGGCVGQLYSGDNGAIMNDIEVKDINFNSNIATIGGCIGEGCATINNAKVTNMTAVATDNSTIAAGFIARNYGAEFSDIELNSINITMENMIYSDNIDSSSVAGVIGEDAGNRYNSPYTEDTLNGIKLNNITLTVNEGTTETRAHVGGIVGISMFNKEINYVDVDGLTINSNSSTGIVGGVVGLVEANNVTITNSNIKDITATGKYAVGGILGCGTAKIDNCTVANPIINANSERGVAGSAVGIAVEGSELSNIGIISEGEGNYGVFSDGLAGGIVAMNAGSLKDSSVSNITVKTTIENVPASDEDEYVSIYSGMCADAIQVKYIDMYVNCTHENVNVIAGNV